jgi:hypothetical protein
MVHAGRGAVVPGAMVVSYAACLLHAVLSNLFGKGPAGKSLAQPLPAARGPKQAHVAFVSFPFSK